MIRAFDIETFNDGYKLIPYCVSFCYEDQKKTFYGMGCIDLFLKYTFKLARDIRKTDKNQCLYIFSHNLTFDGSILIQNISDTSSIKFDSILFKGNIFKITLIKKKISITFKCSYKFFPTSLEKAHNMLNTNEKYKFDHNIINYLNYISFKEKCELYCINDSVIVLQIMHFYNDLIKKYRNNWLEDTNSIPSASLKIYEDCFNEYGAKTSSNNEFDDVFRPAYYGGRCEVFGNANEDEIIYHFDFTGMYAQVMKEEFSFGDYEIILNPNSISKNGFFHITYKSEMYMPILPHHREDGRLLFTNGDNISGLYWWEEIHMFIECGGEIKKINFHAKFKKCGTIFKKFIDNFTEIRKTNKQMNIICKSIINSLYGRLGMSDVDSITKIISLEDFKKIKKEREHDIISENHINNIVILETKKHKNNDIHKISSNVSLAAIISSKARIKLIKGFQDVSKNGGRILYTDTDSIFASFKKNVDDMKFGEVFFDTTKNDTRIKQAVFASSKAYAVQTDKYEITKIKGVNRNAISFENFKKNFINRKSIKFEIKVLKKSNYIITSDTVSKIINLNKYEKRVFNTTQKYTLPLILESSGAYNTSDKIKIINNSKNHNINFINDTPLDTDFPSSLS